MTWSDFGSKQQSSYVDLMFRFSEAARSRASLQGRVEIFLMLAALTARPSLNSSVNETTGLADSSHTWMKVKAAATTRTKEMRTKGG